MPSRQLSTPKMAARRKYGRENETRRHGLRTDKACEVKGERVTSTTPAADALDAPSDALSADQGVGITEDKGIRDGRMTGSRQTRAFSDGTTTRGIASQSC